MIWTPAHRVHVLWLQQTNSHGLLSPVEERGHHGHSLKRRVPRLLPWQAFIAFLGTLPRGWSSFTKHRFTLGGYHLQITKERLLLIISKKKDICKCKGTGGWTGYTPYLGGLAQILGSYFKNIQWTFAASIQGEEILAKSKSQSDLGTMQAWFPMGKPIRGHGFSVLGLAFHWPFQVGTGPTPRRMVSYNKWFN